MENHLIVLFSIILAIVVICWRPLFFGRSWIDDVIDEWELLYGREYVESIFQERYRNRFKRQERRRGMIVSHFWHSFLGHPLMALCHLVGADRLGDWVHDRLFVEPPSTVS